MKKLLALIGIISGGFNVLKYNIKILIYKIKETSNKKQGIATGLTTADENTDLMILAQLLLESKEKLQNSIKMFL